jgi:hypothetical protein
MMSPMSKCYSDGTSGATSAPAAMESAQSAPLALQRINDASDRSLILILSDINMLILVVALWLLCILYLFVGSRKIRDTVRLNNDPRQEQLARLLVAVGQGAPMYKITRFLSQQTDQSLDEDWKRVTHALTIVEKLVEPAIYEKARDVGLIVIEASRGGRHKWR